MGPDGVPLPVEVCLDRLLFCLLAALAVTGCEVTDTASYVDMSCPVPAQVDNDCADGGCDSVETLELTIDWTQDETQLAPDAQLELYQYRVDYTFAGVDEEVPYFAAIYPQYIDAGGSVTVAIAPMGDRQRTFLDSYVPAGDVLIGDALVTYEGWDHLDQVLKIEGHCPVWVGDFSAMTTTTPSSSTTSATTF